MSKIKVAKVVVICNDVNRKTLFDFLERIKYMNRRDFILNTAKASMLVGGASMFASTAFANSTSDPKALARLVEKNSTRFKAKFGPNLYGWTNIFPHSYKQMKTASEKIDFLGALGFIAFEDNNFLDHTPAQQQEIADALKRNNMEFCGFTGYSGMQHKFIMTANKDNNGKYDKVASLEFSRKEITKAADTAQKFGVKRMIVVPGLFDDSISMYDGFSNVLEHLRQAVEICQKRGVTMVLEFLCSHAHPGLWLKNCAQTYALCKAVNSPNCKILFDTYHAQFEAGNLFRNIETHFDEIEYFHIADVPNRTEPKSGEINFKNLISFVKGLGYNGIFGMEHLRSDKTLAGEQKMMQIYREIDC